MTRIFYSVPYLLDHRVRYLIWYSNDADGVVIDSAGTIPSFRSEQDLTAYARAEGLDLGAQNGSVLHILDVVRRWLKRKRPGRVDCVEMLAAWNLFSDVSASVGGRFNADKNRTQRIYGKLFWGNNWPSVTPEGRCYVPLWSGREVRVMREVLGKGLAMFREHIRLRG